jgi:hypothetical protein
MSALSMSFFQSTTVIYALGTVVIAFVLLFIPSLMVSGAKPQGIARAISCFLWKAVGLVILSMAVVQLAYGAVSNELPDPTLLSALILLFVVGVGIMVQASRIVKTVDEASVVVVRLVFLHTCELVGGVIALVSVLSIALTVLLTNNVGNWQLPATSLFLGLTTMLAASVHIRQKNKPKLPAKKSSKK